MRDRPFGTARPTFRPLTTAADVVLLTPQRRALAVLLLRTADGRARDRWVLPWDACRPDEGPEQAASRIARLVTGLTPTAFEQVGAFGDGKRHPGDAQLSVSFVGLVPMGVTSHTQTEGAEWCGVTELPPLAPRHRTILDAAVEVIRRRVDQSPMAFRLLPNTFTLSDLQGVYELLLGRSLHKASFRRALHGALLVEPTDEWRSEGRGRPAQLYRFAPRRRRGARRGIRFDSIETA
jgi:8-oxo-dGTP diphosphatase